jgi:hypothetical protein
MRRMTRENYRTLRTVMRYRVGDAPDLTRLLLSVFTDMPQPAVEEGLHRHLWRHARFRYAEHLAAVLTLPSKDVSVTESV